MTWDVLLQALRVARVCLDLRIRRLGWPESARARSLQQLGHERVDVRRGGARCETLPP